jgi:hypothetical protein
LGVYINKICTVFVLGFVGVVGSPRASEFQADDILSSSINIHCSCESGKLDELGKDWMKKAGIKPAPKGYPSDILTPRV